MVTEVYARRMGSPLDSLLRLTDQSGQILAWNDDEKDIESGLITHHADSYLTARLPKTGEYTVEVSDAQGHGGPEYFYWLRVGSPEPDFALRVAPSCLNLRPGATVTATVYAVRRDGWDGDIRIVMKDAPKGFVLKGAKVPKGKEQATITLTVPRGRFDQPLALTLEGQAQIGTQTIARPIIPADDREQAFAYHHLVAAEQLLVMITPAPR
jgi:hypothetical protein